MIKFSSVFLGMCSLVFMNNCGKSKSTKAELEQFQNTNLYGSDVGLLSKELILTFDDGPSAYSLKLAQYLRDEGVSATFFMTGEFAARRIDVVKAISEMKFTNGEYAHTIANHTTSHPKLSAQNALTEIQNTNNIIEKYIKSYFYFRPPYGYLVQNKSNNRLIHEDPSFSGDLLNLLNDSDLKKYIAPIYWDIGGHLNEKYAADWACWSLTEVKKIKPSRNIPLTPTECGERYEREIKDLDKGIILAHDLHAKTVEMIMGSEKTPSLIKKLKLQGFRFVKLDAHSEAIKQWNKNRNSSSFPGDISFSYTSEKSDLGYKILFKASSEGAERIEVRMNEYKGKISSTIDGIIYSKNVNANKKYALSYTQTFSTPGSRYITFSAYKAGNLFARKTFLFKIR